MAPVISVYSDFVSPNGRFILRAGCMPDENVRRIAVDCHNCDLYIIRFDR